MFGNNGHKAAADLERARADLLALERELEALSQEIAANLAAGDDTDDQETQYTKLTARKSGLTRRIADLEQAAALEDIQQRVKLYRGVLQNRESTFDLLRDVLKQGHEMRDDFDKRMMALESQENSLNDTVRQQRDELHGLMAGFVADLNSGAMPRELYNELVALNQAVNNNSPSNVRVF